MLWSDLTSHYQFIWMSQTRVHVTWTMLYSKLVTENIPNLYFLWQRWISGLIIAITFWNWGIFNIWKEEMIQWITPNLVTLKICPFRCEFEFDLLLKLQKISSNCLKLHRWYSYACVSSRKSVILNHSMCKGSEVLKTVYIITLFRILFWVENPKIPGIQPINDPFKALSNWNSLLADIYFAT